MNCFHSFTPSSQAVRGYLAMLTFAIVLVHPVCIRSEAIARNVSDKLEHGDFAAQIECITPDGRVSPVSDVTTRLPNPPALKMAKDTISCALEEGETTFIIPIPRVAAIDRFLFINRNVSACGEFNIAFSNSHLPAASSKWIQVDGIIPFAHKRVFNLSLLGIEASYVKLSFHVEKVGRTERLGLYGGRHGPSDNIAQAALAEQYGKN